MNRKPDITRQGRPGTFNVDAIDEHGNVVATPIAGEHPLTLYLDNRELVTLMTLGAAPEELALGYLRNQRIVRSVGEIAAVQVDWQTDAVAVTSRALLKTGVTLWDDPQRRAELNAKMDKRTVTTGCGQGTVFGDLMAEIDDLEMSPAARLSDRVLYEVLDQMRRHESIYKIAGAVHGCALCDNSGRPGEILRFIEDVGRHNAVDAIAGWMWLNDIRGDDKIFYTTGRLTSEMVIKCAQMGIPILLSRSGLTQMGYDIAGRIGITMIGRCQGKHYLLFTGQHRFVRTPLPAIGY